MTTLPEDLSVVKVVGFRKAGNHPRPEVYVAAFQKVMNTDDNVVNMEDPSLLSRLAAFEDFMSDTVTYMEHRCDTEVTESDVRNAAKLHRYGLFDAADYNLKHDSTEFDKIPQMVVNYVRKTDPMFSKDAQLLLQVVWEGLEFGSFTSTPARKGRKLELDSPVGVTANLFQMDSSDVELEDGDDEEFPADEAQESDCELEADASDVEESD